MAIKLFKLALLLPIILVIDGQNITEPDLLVPNYDNVEYKLKAFAIWQPLVLSCNITKDGNYKLVWEKQGTDVSKVEELEGRYIIIELENKFIIQRAVETDAGHYSCRINQTKKEFTAVAEVLVRTPSNIVVSEENDFSVECVVVGTKPKLHWQFGNLTVYNSTDKYILEENEDGVDNGILTVLNASLSDRGEYKCIAENVLTNLNISSAISDVTFVRVKNKFAALWPAMGIGIEIVILCVMTIIFEKMSKKLDLDEGDE